jgi:alpha-tubulin suppressor-like RCC1 family protein
MPANNEYALLLDTSGNHYFACGKNVEGQLGTGTTTGTVNFVQVNLPVKFIAIVASCNSHSLGISEWDGALWSWGSNSHGQLGLGEEISLTLIPTQIPNTHSFVQISAGHQYSLALDSYGHVWVFGEGEFGCLGLGSDKVENQFFPKQIEIPVEIKLISAGVNTSLLVDKSGCVWSFGYNSSGELGHGNQETIWSPCKIEALQDIIQVSCGYSHCLALNSLGNVWGFGFNCSGQLGISNKGFSTFLYTPEIIPNLDSIVQIFAVGHSSIFKNEQQQVFLVGDNRCFRFGQAHPDICIPIEVENWKGKTIIPGGDHVLIIDELGNLFFYGALEGIPEVKGQQEGIVIAQKKHLLTKRAIG